MTKSCTQSRVKSTGEVYKFEIYKLGGGGGITVLHMSVRRMLKVKVSPVAYIIFTVYFALVKADFVYMCKCFLVCLEMFKYIELVYLFSVLEVFSAWRLKNQFLFTTGCVKCCTFLFIDVYVGWFVLISVLCFRFRF